MFRFSVSIISLIVLAVVLVVGCKQQQEEPPAVDQPAAPEVKRPLQVSVPEEVVDRWQAVKIAVMNKENGQQEVYTIDIGGSVEIPDADLTLAVKNFLPAFVIDGTTMTSAGNELKNPGAQVEISQAGKIVYQGWIFSLYPGTHAFKHPSYSFTLVDFVPKE